MNIKISIEHGIVTRVLVLENIRGLLPCGCFIQNNGNLIACDHHQLLILDDAHKMWNELVSKIER